MRSHSLRWFAQLCCIAFLAIATTSAVAVETSPYVTGFESDETPGFALGDLNGQGTGGSWAVSEGAASVQGATVARGAQAVESGEGSVIDVALDGAANVIWVDAFVKTSGSADAPTVPAEVRSSVLFFSSSSGILALDGDGGGSGEYVTVVGAFPTGEFIRVSIRQDYTAKTYDVWVNGVSFATDLGFKDSSVTQLNGAQRRSAAVSYLDDFSATEWGLGADADGDGLIDLDEVKFYGTDPELPDTDGDGSDDPDELIAGTDATDPASFFQVGIEPGAGGPYVTVPTITGRVYTLQRKDGPADGTWQDVPAFTDVAGDDTLQGYTDTDGMTGQVYRGIVSKP